jgi:hypothetical protein
LNPFSSKVQIPWTTDIRAFYVLADLLKTNLIPCVPEILPPFP